MCLVYLVYLVYFTFILHRCLHYHLNDRLTSWFYDTTPSEIRNGLRLVSRPSVLRFTEAPSARCPETPRPLRAIVACASVEM